jgi:hypothetical protein
MKNFEFKNYKDFIYYIKNLKEINPIILVEGKRKVKEKDVDKIKQFGKKIAKDLSHCIFRTGNAGGSDQYFIDGILKIKNVDIEYIVPYKKHRNKHMYETAKCFSIDTNITKEIIDLTKQSRPNMSKIIDYYLQGGKSGLTAKVRYLLRDTMKVTGMVNKINKGSLAILYVDEKNKYSGGTGHTLQICEYLNIPYITQKYWLNWVS